MSALTDGEVDELDAACEGNGEYLCCHRTTHRKTGTPVGGQILDAVERILTDRLVAHEALREASRAMVRVYDAACPDWWPQEIDDLRDALAASEAQEVDGDA